MNKLVDTSRAWLLLDERASHRSQILGVAERLGIPFDIKEIRYNKFAALANAVAGARLWHLTAETRALIAPPWPELVIAAGRRSAPVSLAIKKHSPATKLVHLMWPDTTPNAFDLIAVPEHDAHHREGANILHTFGAPGRIMPETLRKEATRWQNKVARLPHPRIALLVGGSSGDAEYLDADFRTLAAYASAEAEKLNGSLLITTSPRTGKAPEALMRSILTVPYFFHSYVPDGDNPYLGLLGLADIIIATGDSISMCSEACATGKPVYIFLPPHLKKAKKGFRETLFARGAAKPHTYPIRLDWQPLSPPDAAGEVARAIETRLFGQDRTRAA